MTERSESERAELVALDPLEMLLDAARYAEGNGGKYRNLAWAGAARAAVAKARLDAQEHKPVAWCSGDELDNILDDRTATVSGVRDGFRNTPLYLAPQPAPGWDGLARAYLVGRGYDACKIDDLKEANSAEWSVALQITKALLRSSQSTSDAGGGVREYEPVAFMFWNEPDTQRHFTQLKETIGSHWSNVKPLYANPAAADSNASAEARLRDALEASGDALDEYYRYWTGGESRGSYDGRPERNNLWKAMYAVRAALNALSPDPHASDCEKQGETPCNYVGPCGWKEERPSDRPADVRGNPDGLCGCTWTCEKRDNCRDRARNTVGRR